MHRQTRTSGFSLLILREMRRWHRKWSITWFLHQFLEWTANSLLIGETERVPYVWHNLFKDEWAAIGKILLKDYIDTGYFSVILNKAFVLYTLFGEVGVVDMLSSLFLYLSNDEANILKGLLDEESGMDDFPSDKFFKFLWQFKVRSLVTKCIIKEKLA